MQLQNPQSVLFQLYMHKADQLVAVPLQAHCIHLSAFVVIYNAIMYYDEHLDLMFSIII